MTRYVLAAVLAAGLATVSLASAQAANFTPDSVDMAAAKKEGKVSWYTSTPIDLAQKIAKLFESESGIHVELFRSGGQAVLSRFLQERKAGRIAADLLTQSDPAAAADLAKQGVFVAFKPTNFDKVPAEVKDPDGYYIAQRLNMLLMTARTDKVAAADLPKTWSDLANPKYKGMEVMPDPSFTALQLVVVGTLSHKLGWSYYEGLRKNDILIVQGHEQVYDMVKRGERVIGAEGIDPRTYTKGEAAPNIATIYPTEGTIAVASPTAIIKGAPDPNAAKAFAEFMIGDAVQKLFPTEGTYAARTDVEPPPGNPPLAQLKLMAVDYPQIQKDTAAIKDHFNEIFQ